MIEKNTHEKEKLVIKYRKKSILAGIVLWVVILLSSIIGTMFVSWIMIPISIGLGLIGGLYIGRKINNNIREKTGLSTKEQQSVWVNSYINKK